MRHVGIHVEPDPVRPLVDQIVGHSQLFASLLVDTLAHVPTRSPHLLDLLQLQQPTFCHQCVQPCRQTSEVVEMPEGAQRVSGILPSVHDARGSSPERLFHDAQHPAHRWVAGMFRWRHTSVKSPLGLSIQEKLTQATTLLSPLGRSRVLVTENGFLLVVSVRSGKTTPDHPTSPAPPNCTQIVKIRCRFVACSSNQRRNFVKI
mmetsp:Transcript_70997/g.147949  ORF Transcript_70997/g.147949 Transcript_70997/m.147949 type:complete len:204 (+) Transcript_70997:4569-5180(+)